jgi:hypothetical protein
MKAAKCPALPAPQDTLYQSEKIIANTFSAHIVF